MSKTPNPQANKTISDKKNLEQAVQSTVDHLYNLKADVSLETYSELSKIRQSINECYVHKNKTIGINKLWRLVEALLTEARADERQAMLDALPEKLLAEAKSDWGRGFDEAINQMESAIKLMGEKYTEMEQL